MLLSHKLLIHYGSLYPYVKALHVAFIIFLMAGLLYLPRLFIYHRQMEGNPEAHVLFQTMEKRLMRFIIHPCWVVVFLTGLFLLYPYLSSFSREGLKYLEYIPWLLVKLTCVLLLAIYYGFCVRWKKSIEGHHYPPTQRFLRYINEIPAILALIIVFMVIVKPWS